MKKSKPKRLSVKAEYMMNLKYMGEEPSWPEGTCLTKEAELHALNWYSTMMDAEDARGILVEWLMEQGQPTGADQMKNLDAMWIPRSVAWVVQIQNRGGVFHEMDETYVFRQIDTALKHYKPKEAKPDKPTVRDHVNDKLNDMIADIDAAIDDKDKSFTIPKFIKDRDISPALVAKLYEHYSPLYTEFCDSLTDKETVRRADWKDHKMYMAAIVADLFLINGNNKDRPKAPRKKRKVNMEVKMRHFKPHPDTKVKPESVIGAQEVWLINVKNNIVTALYAAGPKGLDIHRTAITGYDNDTSVSKRCGRHVDNVVNVVHKGSKVARRKLINETIKTAAIDIKDRVTEDVIILFSSK